VSQPGGQQQEQHDQQQHEQPQHDQQPHEQQPHEQQQEQPPPPPTAVAGVFEFEGSREDWDFNLRPKAGATSIPEDQRNVAHDVYEARNILSLLRTQRGFLFASGRYDEFLHRITQAAHVGCIDASVNPALAMSALAQIRTDVVRRKGRAIVYSYLAVLAAWALGAALLSQVIVWAFWASFHLADAWNYRWLLTGAPVGAWMSLAAGRSEISFDAIQDFVDRRIEPFVRLAFVMLLALAIGFLVELKAMAFKLGPVDLVNFANDGRLAFVLGLVVGLSERALSIKMIDRLQKAIPS
jgi:hypothetical protein